MPYWQINPWDRHVGSLSAEYRNRNGIAEIIDENQSNFQFYKLVHQNGFLLENVVFCKVFILFLSRCNSSK
jgi:hypothetical protein